MAELPWFKFNPSEWLSGGISFCSYITQGIFIQACSQYWKAGCNLSEARLKARLRLDEAQLKQSFSELLNEGVIHIVDGEIVISFLDEQHQELSERKTKLSEAGRKGGRVSKPGLSQAKATPKHKETETETETEGEGETEEPETASLGIDDLRIYCYIGPDEAKSFEKLFKPFSRKQGLRVISVLKNKRIKAGERERPCMSDLSPYIQKNFNQIKEW